ncbi:sigma-70 family RNA polymerase sigma factor [Candidatus Poribacteria bacterium]|nr:sigma-70 family RNA polymerase sigma factor [Candidatus Poribacteria bacterium]
MSDPEIIQRVLSGEKEAFSILVKKYQNAIHGIAFHTTQNTHDAEDIAQETFMEAFHRLPTLREPDKFPSWLRAITNNLCANWIRKKNSQANLETQLSSRSQTSEVCGDFGSLRIDTYEALMKVVNMLSEPNRIVIILKYLEGLSNLEIAEFLGISTSVVNVRIHRSMKQLQGKITKALEDGFKDKRLDESFAERVNQRIAERKPVTAITVNFGDATEGQRVVIKQLIRNSNATIQDTSLSSEVSTSQSHLNSTASFSKGGRGDLSKGTLTAFYGVPTTRESDPIRAANTALAIQEQFREGTKIGIGLCFGTVELQRQPDGIETFVPTTQLIPRLSMLQAAAKEGIISDDLMYQLLETRYEFEEGECLRGESQIYTYQLLSAHDLSSPTIPLIGRHAELELLKAEVEKVLLGGSSFVLITGEAGIGKTRLVTELRAHYSESPLFWLQGQCPSDGYFNYAPIVEAMNAYLTPRVRLRDELMRFGMENAIPYLADFLSLPIDIILYSSMSSADGMRTLLMNSQPPSTTPILRDTSKSN